MRPNRRSFVLVAVLVIAGSAILIATGLLFSAQTQAMASSVSADTASSRALAWSGVQAVMSVLNDQRDRLLQGQLPQIERQYVIYEGPQRLGIVRLLPFHAESDQVLVPEAGKLDVNSADADALVRTGLIDPSTAAAIVAHRDQALRRPYQSVIELLDVPGQLITPEMVYGPIERVGLHDASADGMRSESSSGPRGARLSTAPVLGLADILTVFSVEPALQQNGKLRINLNVPWSDELGARIEDRFGIESAKLVKQIYESGTTFESDAKIFQALRFFKTPPEDWPPIVDAFTTEAGEFHFGRLDINTAPYAALLALPGLTPEQASQIVSLREELSDAERASIAWLATAQVVPAEAYDALAGKITTRCWTYRVRIAAGEVDAERPDGPMFSRVVYEAVIDLSAPRPRIAYLREITVLEDTARLALSEAQRFADEFDRVAADGPDEEEAEVAARPAATRPDGAGEPPDQGPTSQPAGGEGSPDPRAPARNDRRRIGRWL
jgi:DNA uptake protein ComE-like DNA-binding protein